MTRNIRKEPCIVSGTKNYSNYSEGLIKNNDSGLVVAEKIPDEKQLKKLYEKEYFFGMEYSDYKADRPALEKNFKNRITRLKKKGFINGKTNIVEVGCAYGYFLNLLKDDVARHQGFDVTADGVKFAKNELGVNASTSNFLTTRFDKKVDMVCMWDVIEHVGHPEEFVKKASSILKKGGALALTTGDIGTLVPKIRKGKWRMIHPPTHIYYFDKKSMTALLEKYGFDVKSYRYDAIYRNVGSILNQLIVNQKVRGGSAKLLSIALRFAEATRLNKLNFAINLYDVMDVVAVKNR